MSEIERDRERERCRQQTDRQTETKETMRGRGKLERKGGYPSPPHSYPEVSFLPMHSPAPERAAVVLENRANQGRL